MVEERVKTMKDYLLEIAGVPPSEDTPPPHLERHQAWLLLGGYHKHHKNLETYGFGANTFSYYIFPDVMRQLENLFQAKPKQRKGFVPLMACMDTFLKYDLPEYIPDQCYYVNTVLVFEVVTKMLLRDGNRDRSGDKCPNQDTLWHWMGFSRWRKEAQKGACQSSEENQS